MITISRISIKKYAYSAQKFKMKCIKMKSFTSILLLFIYANISLIPQLDEVDLYNKNQVQIEDINSIIELLIISLELDNIADDEDDDCGDSVILVVYHHYFNTSTNLFYSTTPNPKYNYTEKPNFWFCHNYNESYTSISSPPPKIT